MLACMKAIAANHYGGPDVLALIDLPDPKVGPDSVLVRTRAAGVNPVDWKILEGRMDAALRVHFPLVPGWDLAGVVERVGAGVSELGPGDEVIGYVREDHVQCGTYAELVAAPIRTLARKPARLDWRQAAGLPLAGLTALQTLDALAVRAGDVVLVHAASGGVGSLAVQIAHARGARVIGTAGVDNHAHVRELGGEPIAYGDGLVERVRALAPDGVSAIADFGGNIVGHARQLLRAPGTGLLRLASIVDGSVKQAGGRYVFVRPSTRDLETLGELADGGQLTVPIAESLPLARAAQALERSKQGHTRGKIVLDVG
jgi:NADPH:quinone reductase-like Zn-dependent oxidoreductase